MMMNVGGCLIGDIIEGGAIYYIIAFNEYAQWYYSTVCPLLM